MGEIIAHLYVDTKTPIGRKQVIAQEAGCRISGGTSLGR